MWGVPYRLQGDGRTSRSLLDSLAKLRLRLTFSLPFMAGGTLSFQLSLCVQIFGSSVGSTAVTMFAVPPSFSVIFRVHCTFEVRGMSVFRLCTFEKEKFGVHCVK